jgi:hypothetical protein
MRARFGFPAPNTFKHSSGALGKASAALHSRFPAQAQTGTETEALVVRARGGGVSELVQCHPCALSARGAEHGPCLLPRLQARAYVRMA